jgi:outer membrane protein
MTGRKKATTIVKAFVAKFLIFALSASAVRAADLPTDPPAAPVSPAPEAAPRWFVRLGALGALDQSWSSLFAQPLAEVVVPGIGLVPVGGFGPQVSLVGRGATYSSSFSASFQAGYFFTPNWSLEVSSGVPLWLTIKITGFSATPPFSGTVLSKLLPGVVPITAVYHFTQLGALQPYLGGGIVPSFELAVQDGFNTGGSFAPTVGLVAQAGSDYMFNRNWGVFLDVKKLFIWSTGKSTGFDLGPPIGTIPGAATIKTTFQPWLFSTGVTYRF